MSSLNPIDSLFPSSGFPSLPSPSSIPGSFGNVFDQAMSQSTSKAQSAKLQWIQSQYMKQATLYDMFSDSKTSILGFGASDLFSTDGLFGLPSWAYDLQRVLGNESNVQDLIRLNDQASQILQNQLHSSSSAGLGSTGGNFESMF